ncbi:MULTISPECIES: DUF6542 domain-containing protein [unclassified Streptomyces]|uniref:DUF6542 domain-containing protein n=1 Tax=Streptomyces sp. NBRC 14336 TaxID=3030992 RepID=UPI002553816C|nr:DUF6542 domain-containing protein [Streptomyces sp. NBRC 14336]WBO80136.1 hypothetical protein SBE_003888 [Streptomyces sp. SBE_14.2]
MEQHRTRPAQDERHGQQGTRRGAPLPSQVRGGVRAAQARPGAGRRPADAVRRPPPPVVQALRRLPNPRLTGLGVGLFCLLVMLALGSLLSLLFGSALTAYGVLFLPVCVLTAAWVRKADLVTAVVIVPIAFAVGLVPVADSGAGGTGDRLMGLFTALATEAGWLYVGTMITGVIVTVRKVRLMRRRVAAARSRAVK